MAAASFFRPITLPYQNQLRHLPLSRGFHTYPCIVSLNSSRMKSQAHTCEPCKAMPNSDYIPGKGQGVKTKLITLWEFLTREETYPYEITFLRGTDNPISSFLLSCVMFWGSSFFFAKGGDFSKFLAVAQKSAFHLAVAWFFIITKTNALSRLSAMLSFKGYLLDKCILLDKMVTVVTIVSTLMAAASGSFPFFKDLLPLAELGGHLFSVSAGLAAALSLKDALRDIFSGINIHFQNLFRVGEKIKRGSSLEGKVVGIGLTRTILLSNDNSLISVSNSAFFEKELVNESRVAYKAVTTKISLQTEDLEKIKLILTEITELFSSREVALDDPAQCFLTCTGSCFVLNLRHNLENKSMAQIWSGEQDILLKAMEIIGKHGVSIRDK